MYLQVYEDLEQPTTYFIESFWPGRIILKIQNDPEETRPQKYLKGYFKTRLLAEKSSSKRKGQLKRETRTLIVENFIRAHLHLLPWKGTQDITDGHYLPPSNKTTTTMCSTLSHLHQSYVATTFVHVTSMSLNFMFL